MSGIGSTLRRRWVEVAWGVFAAANVTAIVLMSRWETIPFHFVWVSLTLVYGFRRWRFRTTMLLLLVVIASTGAALAVSIARGHQGPDELAEVPLMAAMFLAMVWYAVRRQAAVEEAGRLAASEHRLLMGQREFVRDASHELRTPITVARGHAELIRDASIGGQISNGRRGDPRRARSPLSPLGAAADPHDGRPSRFPVAERGPRRAVPRRADAPVGADRGSGLADPDRRTRDGPGGSRAAGDGARRPARECRERHALRRRDPRGRVTRKARIS